MPNYVIFEKMAQWSPIEENYQKTIKH